MTKPKFNTAIVAIGRFEDRYAEEWVAYHIALKFDHFYIYDNADPGENDVAFLEDRFPGYVTVIPFPGRKMQGPAYVHFVARFAHHCEWVAFIDFDEFFVFREDKTVDAFLAKYGYLEAIGLNWLSFGHSGHSHRVNGLIIDNFTWRYPVYLSEIKSILMANTINKIESIHNINGKSRLINGFDLKGASRLHPKTEIEYSSRLDTTSAACINHYFTRSLEDLETKASRGSAAGAVDGKRNFDWYLSSSKVFNSRLDIVAPTLVRSIISGDTSTPQIVRDFFDQYPWPCAITLPDDFDADWYKTFYRDIPQQYSAVDCALHFQTIGAHEDRSWSQRSLDARNFNSTLYLQCNPALAANGVSHDNAYYHYALTAAVNPSSEQRRP